MVGIGTLYSSVPGLGYAAVNTVSSCSYKAAKRAGLTPAALHGKLVVPILLKS
jgi:hypothetical protein